MWVKGYWLQCNIEPVKLSKRYEKLSEACENDKTYYRYSGLIYKVRLFDRFVASKVFIVLLVLLTHLASSYVEYYTNVIYTKGYEFVFFSIIIFILDFMLVSTFALIIYELYCIVGRCWFCVSSKLLTDFYNYWSNTL